jgi:hypothetical protein
MALQKGVCERDPVGRSLSKTIRAARSRTSAEYLLGRAMHPSSQGIRSPAIPGRFKSTKAYQVRNQSAST